LGKKYGANHRLQQQHVEAFRADVLAQDGKKKKKLEVRKRKKKKKRGGVPGPELCSKSFVPT